MEPAVVASSTRNPDRHARLDVARIASRIEAQPQRIAIVIADRALGLPGREGTEWPHFGDDGRYRLARTRTGDLDRRPNRETVEQVLACIERQPLLPVRRD